MSSDKDYGAPVNGGYIHMDESGQCQACFTNDTQIIGFVHLDGVAKRSVIKCNSCSQVTVDDPPGVKNIIDQVKSATGAQHVTFEAVSNSQVVSSNPIGVSQDVELDYDSKSKFDQMNDHLMSLQNAMVDLVAQMRSIAEQNHQLQEELVKDPMKHVRKMISEFNLE